MSGNTLSLTPRDAFVPLSFTPSRPFGTQDFPTVTVDQPDSHHLSDKPGWWPSDVYRDRSCAQGATTL